MQGNGRRRMTAGTDSERGGWAPREGPLGDRTPRRSSTETTSAPSVPARPADLRAVRRLVQVPRDDRGCPWLGARLAGVGHPAQVHGIDHPADPAWSGTTVLSDDLATAIADLKAKPGASCGYWQWHPDPVAAGDRSGRRDDSDYRSRGSRPGRAVVPGRRPGHCARSGRLASRREGRNDPGVYRPTGRPEYRPAGAVD